VFLPTHCLAIVVACTRLLLDVTASRGGVFTERCVIMEGMDVRDVTRGNAEFT
jgi:hypothetical protein